MKEFEADKFLFFATRHGIVKKTPLDDYVNIRKGGLIAINLREDDDLIGVRLTDGEQEIIMGTSNGMSIRFPEKDVRSMGRSATGVKGITLDDDDFVIGMDVVSEDNDVLIVSSKGYGKRTPMSEYRIQSRGGKGIKTINVTVKNGPCRRLEGRPAGRGSDDHHLAWHHYPDEHGRHLTDGTLCARGQAH